VLRLACGWEIDRMCIAVIGPGYVGLVSGGCFSEFGVSVTCVDKDAAKIARLQRREVPTFEPGLEALVTANAVADRLASTTDLAAAVAGADAVFIAVGTPSRRGDGHADLSYVFAAAEEIGRALTGYAVVMTKSTVPVGVGSWRPCTGRGPKGGFPRGGFDVASSPEFLREGSAIEDFMRPDRVVIGADGARARAVPPAPSDRDADAVHRHRDRRADEIRGQRVPLHKITFINEIADLFERVGADVQDVVRGIGLDGRIGRKFLHAGPGFGGSCFPKDCRALVGTAREAEAGLAIVETVVRVNDARRRRVDRSSPNWRPARGRKIADDVK
jgi:UDPglucose 6-dehydrogenase